MRARADEVISFGKITFPHQLIRIVTEEQIYRAFTINNNVAYHKYATRFGFWAHTMRYVLIRRHVGGA